MGTISISVKEHNKHLTVTISDDGVGQMAADEEKDTSFGLRMVNILTRQLNAEVSKTTTDGTHYNLVVPM